MGIKNASLDHLFEFPKVFIDLVFEMGSTVDENEVDSERE